MNLFQFLYQYTPLHIAVKEGQEYTVRCLVKNGAKDDIGDKNGVSKTFSNALEFE